MIPPSPIKPLFPCSHLPCNIRGKCRYSSFKANPELFCSLLYNLTFSIIKYLLLVCPFYSLFKTKVLLFFKPSLAFWLHIQHFLSYPAFYQIIWWVCFPFPLQLVPEVPDRRNFLNSHFGRTDHTENTKIYLNSHCFSLIISLEFNMWNHLLCPINYAQCLITKEITLWG